VVSTYWKHYGHRSKSLGNPHIKAQYDVVVCVPCRLILFIVSCKFPVQIFHTYSERKRIQQYIHRNEEVITGPMTWKTCENICYLVIQYPKWNKQSIPGSFSLSQLFPNIVLCLYERKACRKRFILCTSLN
jgi:hypothetical protein